MNEFKINSIYNDAIGVDIKIVSDSTISVDMSGSFNTIPKSEQVLKDIFCEVVTCWKNVYDTQEGIEETFGIDLLNYNYTVYECFRKIILLMYDKKEIEEIVSWYVMDRQYLDEDTGEFKHYEITYNNDNAPVDVSTVEKLYEFISHLNTFELLNLITEFDGDSGSDEDDEDDDFNEDDD